MVQWTMNHGQVIDITPTGLLVELPDGSTVSVAQNLVVDQSAKQWSPQSWKQYTGECTQDEQRSRSHYASLERWDTLVCEERHAT